MVKWELKIMIFIVYRGNITLNTTPFLVLAFMCSTVLAPSLSGIIQLFNYLII